MFWRIIVPSFWGSESLYWLLGPEDEGLRSPRRLLEHEDDGTTVLQSIGNCSTVDIVWYSRRQNLQQHYSEGLESCNMKVTNNFCWGTLLYSNNSILSYSESWRTVVLWTTAYCCALKHCSNPFVFCQQLLSYSFYFVLSWPWRLISLRNKKAYFQAALRSYFSTYSFYSLY